jgi:hypothetical protein
LGKVKQIIMLYLHGGPPQQEMFDPKPNGPSVVRGEFGAISTSVPGVQFGELFPQTAKLAHQLAVVRSMSHDNPNHVQACLPANTGHVHPKAFRSKGDFPPSDTDFPPFGAVLDHVRPAVGNLPTWVRVGPLMSRSNGTTIHGQTPGFLGEKHSSFAVDQKLLPADVEVQAIKPNPELTSLRLQSRRSLLKQFDESREILDQSATAKNVDTFYQKAFGLLSSEETRKAFLLRDEKPTTRERYGKSEFGQRCLLARRLAEAGVPMTTVSYCHKPSRSWDTHSRHFTRMKDSLAPTFDTALSALIEDLRERSMLDETLVFVNAEFGRTPTINKNSGRDHWPWAYSLALAGAGVSAGAVHGASDESAAYVTQSPHDPRDMAATIYQLLGVPHDTILHDKANRPHHLIIGKPIDPVIV